MVKEQRGRPQDPIPPHIHLFSRVESATSLHTARHEGSICLSLQVSESELKFKSLVSDFNIAQDKVFFAVLLHAIKFIGQHNQSLIGASRHMTPSIAEIIATKHLPT